LQPLEEIEKTAQMVQLIEVSILVFVDRFCNSAKNSGSSDNKKSFNPCFCRPLLQLNKKQNIEGQYVIVSILVFVDRFCNLEFEEIKEVKERCFNPCFCRPLLQHIRRSW
jgi:hypothetical protein